MSEMNYQHEVRGYLTGFALALFLTLVPFAFVVWGGFGAVATLIVLGGCALAQFVVQLRFFLHIDLHRQKREDLQLILFSILLLVIMAGGTIWIVGNLGMRMM